MIRCFRAFNQLQSNVNEANNMDILFRCITRRDDIPVALGKGCVKLADKCAGLAHKWWFLTGTHDSLLAFRRSYCSFCTDLGTEVSVPEFRVGPINTLLPAWAVQPVQPSEEGQLPMEPDVHMDDQPHFDEDFDCGLAPQPPVQGPLFPGDQGSFLPCAVTIPGAMHIVNNLVREVSDKLVHWDTFFKQLQTIELLWKVGRIDRYKEYCLQGTDWADWDHEFDFKLGSLYKERWGEVIAFCYKVEHLLPILRLTWDAQKYVEGGSGFKVCCDRSDE
jgi:hypothetical protein